MNFVIKNQVLKFINYKIFEEVNFYFYGDYQFWFVIIVCFLVAF